jgi:hypothetical protein
MAGMKASTIKEFEAAAERWMEANPRQPRERIRPYARRVMDGVKSRNAGFDWSLIIQLAPLFLRIIEMIIERRKS